MPSECATASSKKYSSSVRRNPGWCEMVATLAKQTICNKRPGFERSDTLSFKEANRRLIFTTLPPCPPKHRSAHISRKQTLSKASEKWIRSQLLERCVIYYLLIIALCIRPSYDDLSCCEIESCFAIDLWPCLFLLCWFDLLDCPRLDIVYRNRNT